MSGVNFNQLSTGDMIFIGEDWSKDRKATIQKDALLSGYLGHIEA